LTISFSFQASSVIDDNWFITGGNYVLNKTLAHDRFFHPMPPLLGNKQGHCQLTINSTHVFVTGGEMSTQSFMFDWQLSRWSELEPMPNYLNSNGERKNNI